MQAFSCIYPVCCGKIRVYDMRKDAEMFKGFTKDTSEFFWGITFNNEREWFLPRKEQFETCVNRPMKELGADCLEIMNARFPKEDFHLHVSRIYRDARRLFGRGPYKDHMWFSLWSGSRPELAPNFWFEIGAARYECGMGFPFTSPALMAAVRRAIDANPARFERLAAKIEDSGRYVIGGAEYKRPKGDPGGRAKNWYNRRDLYIVHRADCGGAELTGELTGIVTDCFVELMDMYDFLSEAALAAETEVK